MNIQETIHAAVKEMADTTKDLPANTDAAFTVVAVSGRTQLAVAGREDDIVVALAEAMINAPKIKDFVTEALTLALLKDTETSDADICTCANCVNYRKSQMSNPNVN